MTIEEQIMKLQTYKMFEGEDTVYVDRDDLLKILEQKSCEDAISRQALYEWLDGWKEKNKYYHPHTKNEIIPICEVIDIIQSLPSVTPKLKIGHWLDIMVGDMPAQACDRCNTFYPLAYTGGGHNYCPNCGAKMESEVEE